MTMPKGHKTSEGYFTVGSIPGADDYKVIASKCTSMGYEMGSSSARNIFLSAMVKIADSVRKSNHLILNEKELYNIAKSPRFQMSVAELLKGQ